MASRGAFHSSKAVHVVVDGVYVDVDRVSEYRFSTAWAKMATEHDRGSHTNFGERERDRETEHETQSKNKRFQSKTIKNI